MKPAPAVNAQRLEQLKAISSDVRFQILAWLKSPSEHFPDQVTGEADEIGVCVSLIAKKLNISQPTASRHLDILKRADLVYAERVQTWSFYKRDEEGIRQFRDWLSTI